MAQRPARSKGTIGKWFQSRGYSEAISACLISGAHAEPDLVGWIDSMHQVQEGENRGQILVESHDDKTSNKYEATVTNGALIRKQSGKVQQQADFNALKVGRKVDIWFSGPVMESYPEYRT